MGRFTAAKRTLIWFVVRPNLWECGDLRSHMGVPAVLFVTKMEISDEQVNICGACSRDSLELLSVSQLKLPGAKRPWLHLLWSAMQITGDVASRELGRAVARLRPSG